MINKYILIIIILITIFCTKEKVVKEDIINDDIIKTEMATYYVSTSGNNGNAGTLASPWRNLSYACSTAITPGDIIHVISGTYNETTQCSLRVGVSIEGEGKTASIIKSSVTTSGQYAISLTSSNSNTNGNQHITGIRIESTTAYASFAGIGIIKRGNVEVYNCTIVNFNYYGIALHNGEQSGSYAVGNKVHDNIITNCSGYIGGDSRGALNISSQDGLLIYNNTIVNARADGNNGNCIDGVEGFIKNMKVYNNTLTKTYVYGVTAWEFCIEIWNWEGGNEIYNNNITGSVDVQYARKGSSTYSVWIHNNIIGQPVMLPKQSTRGVLLEEWNSDVYIERNHFHDICQGVWMRGKTGGSFTTSNIYIRYNLFTNIGAASGGSAPSPSGWGFYCSQTDYDDIFNNFNFINNVVIASIAANALTTCWGCGIPDCGVATEVNISNNIIMNFDTAPIVGQGWNQGTTADQVAIFNNIYYNNGNGNAIKLLTGFTITNLTGVTPQTSIIADPLFVSASDFHLQAGSDGIDGGIDFGILYDYEGYPVTDPPNIGIYEAGSSPVVSPPPVTPPIPVMSVTVVGAGGRTVINTDNGTLQMYANVLPADADDLTVTWSVINGTGTASISATGLLTAITNGTVTVKATSNG